jgi:hypothetical protein
MNLAVGPLCCREANILTAVAAIKFMMETLGSEYSKIAREVQTTLELRISQRPKNLSQVLQYLQSGTQDNSELFLRLSKDSVVKIILRLIKRIFSSENDEQNSTVGDQHGTEHPQILSKIRTCLTKMRYSH